MANFNGSLEAVDCDIHSVRYDMAVNRKGTYEVLLVATKLLSYSRCELPDERE